jgi:cellulose synthase/poly-beta-1,6-N-acetylglucosamine synthase-like glycosyltransferase
VSAPTITIVIPAYNEARYIRRCLESIKRQSKAPDQVILVNNNCTDDTMLIAKEYDFVMILDVDQQGISYAISAGFDRVKSDIIARTDADTAVGKHWVKNIAEVFGDPNIDCITGSSNALELFPRMTMIAKYFSIFGIAKNRFKFRFYCLSGANMAIRRSAWQKISNLYAHDDVNIHEDMDMSILLHRNNIKVRYSSKIKAYTRIVKFFDTAYMREYRIKAKKTVAYHYADNS